MPFDDDDDDLAESTSESSLVDLNQLEREWAEQLQNASLVVQVDYRDQDAILALRRIGYFFQTKKTDQILRSYPASFLVGLNYVASSQMQQGTLWPFIFQGLNGLSSTQPLQEAISRIHRLALNKFQLERFEHPLGRIGEILLHAGIPVSSQEKFVRKLIREFKTKENFDSASFNESIRSISGDRVQASSLDKQIWHFINQAGDVADDFVSKCIEILDDPENPASGAGLPQRVVTEVARIVDELGRSDLKRAGRFGFRLKPPKIIWSNTSENQLEVVFPALPESRESAVRWSVETEEDLVTVDISQEIAGLAREERSLELSKPAAQITVRSESLSSSEELVARTWTLTLFPEELPVMFFDSEGKLDLGKGPLQPGQVRVLYPAKSRLSTSTPSITVEGGHQKRLIDAPLGWGGHGTESSEWLASEINAEDAEAIEITFGTGSKPFRRAISVFRKPRPLQNGLVAGIFDFQDAPVFCEFPKFEVGSLAGAGDEWDYQIRSEDRTLVWSAPVLAEKGIVQTEAPQDLSGTFTIQISKGFGQTTSVVRTVIPGLRSSYDGKVRRLRPDGTGLDETSFSILLPGAGEQELKFGSTQRVIQLQLEQVNGGIVSARPEYEYLQLFNTRSRRHTEWIEPTKSNVENLTELQLFLFSNETSSAALVARWPNEDSQVLKPRSNAPWFKFNLGEISDRANAEGAFKLELKVEQGLTIQAGTCYPRKLFHLVAVDPNVRFVEFTFPGGNVPEGLQVAFYAPLAPWRKPLVVAISATIIELPDELRNLGTLVGTVAVSSPWAPYDFGPNTDFESSNTFEISVLPPSPGLNPENALVHWVMTGEESEQIRAMDSGLAWTCFTRAAEIQSRRGINPFAIKKLAADILAQSQDALEQYPASTRSRTETLIDLIDSGLITQSPLKTQLRVTENLNRPVLAAIGIAMNDPEATSALLDSGSNVWGATHPKDVDADRMDVLRYKLNLLNFKNPEVETMIKLDELLFTQLSDGYLPGRLLDGGNVFINVFKLFYFEADPLTKGLGPDWTSEVIKAVEGVDALTSADLRSLLDIRPLLSAIELRQIPGIRARIANWPAISIRLALAARMAARGDEEAKSIFETNRGFYLKMTQALPSLIEIDLTIAELALREIENPK